MNINLFFQISKEFFDAIHSPYIDTSFLPDEENELINYKELLKLCNDAEELCECSLCYIVRQIILFINPRLLKTKQN